MARAILWGTCEGERVLACGACGRVVRASVWYVRACRVVLGEWRMRARGAWRAACGARARVWRVGRVGECRHVVRKGASQRVASAGGWRVRAGGASGTWRVRARGRCGRVARAGAWRVQARGGRLASAGAWRVWAHGMCGCVAGAGRARGADVAHGSWYWRGAWYWRVVAAETTARRDEGGRAGNKEGGRREVLSRRGR